MYLILLTAVSALFELPIPSVEKPLTQELSQATSEIIKKENSEIITQKNVEKPIEDNAEQLKSIKITNAIDDTMLGYKHWTGTYNPDSFVIYINETEVAQGSEYELASGTTTMDIRYTYSFMKNMYSGTKTVSYKLNENSTCATITFSWHQDPKIIIDNATAIINV